MAKGWTKVKTVNDVERKKMTGKDLNDFNMLVKNTKTLTAPQLKKQSEELYERQQAEDTKLLDAYEDKRVKSKTAIKRAQYLKDKLEKEKEKAEAQSKETKAEVVKEAASA